jgi:uncharacterized protein YkwD
MSAFNFVDLVIVLALLLYTASHIRRGFFELSEQLIAFFGGMIIAFIFYNRLADIVGDVLVMPPGILDALSFILLLFVSQLVLHFFIDKIFSIVPERARYSKPSKVLAILPALFDGLVITALSLMVLLAVPIFPMAKEPIEESRLGSTLVNRVSGFESYIDNVFGRATQETLGFLTVKPEEDEVLYLPFRATALSVDSEAEQKMFELINIEREKAGVPPLTFDNELRDVARGHSENMWEESYFAHYDLEGESPFDRMREAGVRFGAAGENLAMARTVERAHQGLMNSPGHKRNILDPSFTRVGVGVISGGIYGKMFTQNFAD